MSKRKDSRSNDILEDEATEGQNRTPKRRSGHQDASDQDASDQNVESATIAGIASQEVLTYGIELEFLLAFTADELGTVDNMDNVPVKNLPLQTRKQSNFSPIHPLELPNHAYNSWGVLPGGDGTALPKPYNGQPQVMLSKEMPKEISPVRVRHRMTPRDKARETYDRWLITNDHSVCGVGSHNLPNWLPDRIDQQSKDDWDSYGMEIISPVLKTNDSKDEIQAVLRALNEIDPKKYGCFITNQCGLHVHVQAPKDLKVLKMLALILFIYEEEISRLHPPCRHPKHPVAYNNILSNRPGVIILHRDNTEPSDDVINFLRVDHSTEALKSRASVKEFEATLRGIETTKDLSITMNYPGGPPGDFELGDRNRLVNFTSILRGTTVFQERGKASTVEFRQARGTLDFEDVSHWIDFCVGLVRLAEYYDKNRDKFRVPAWEDILDATQRLRVRISVFDLMTDMGLSAPAVRYWKDRVSRFMTGTKGDEFDRTDNEDEEKSKAEDAKRGFI